MAGDCRGANLPNAVRALLGQVGLPPEVAGKYPHELSGGMKQRACIAIAICLRPKVIIADEPTSALDVVVQRQVMETLGRVQADLGAAVILVGHDMGLMAQFVDRLGIMYAGRLVEVAPIARHHHRAAASVHADADRQPAVAGTARARCAAFPAWPRCCAICRPAAPSIRAVPGPRSAAGWKSRRCGRWDRTQQWPAISHDAADRTARGHQDLQRRRAGTGSQRRARTLSPSRSIRSGRAITAVVGESGSGKTTLARLLLGLIEPTEGEVLYQGPRLCTGCRRRGRRDFRHDVQAIFQDPVRGVQPVLPGGPRADDAGAQVPPGAIDRQRGAR